MLDIQSLKDKIDEDAVIAIMDSMDVPLASANSQALVFPSACHHKDYERHKPKLWYYIESQRFHCWVCGFDGDIISLVSHIRKCSFHESIAYICSILHITVDECVQNNDIDPWQRELRRWLPNADYDEPSEPTIYDPAILSTFDHLYPQEWLDYGITADTMDKFGIGWYGRQACISIPVTYNGQLIGCRGRYTRLVDLDKGKYRPITLLDGTVLKFPSSNFMYGFDQNKAAIEQSRQVILFESEKSVLKADSWHIYNTLAVFGSNISKRHIDLLLGLGVNDVVIGFDSDYKAIGDDDFKFFVVKMKKLAAKLRPYFSVSLIYNNQGYDAYKFSPMDYTREQFDKLYASRVQIN